MTGSAAARTRPSAAVGRPIIVITPAPLLAIVFLVTCAMDSRSYMAGSVASITALPPGQLPPDDPDRLMTPAPMRPLIAAASVFALVVSSAPAAHAQIGWLDEAKLGIDAHDITLGGQHREPGLDLNGELLFTSPGLLQAIGHPRPHFGISVNTAGATSYAYFGLTWTATVLGQAFVAGALGGA